MPVPLVRWQLLRNMPQKHYELQVLLRQSLNTTIVFHPVHKTRITTLHNFITPVFFYEKGQYVQQRY